MHSEVPRLPGVVRREVPPSEGVHRGAVRVHGLRDQAESTLRSLRQGAPVGRQLRWRGPAHPRPRVPQRRAMRPYYSGTTILYDGCGSCDLAVVIWGVPFLSVENRVCWSFFIVLHIFFPRTRRPEPVRASLSYTRFAFLVFSLVIITSIFSFNFAPRRYVECTLKRAWLRIHIIARYPVCMSYAYFTYRTAGHDSCQLF